METLTVAPSYDDSYYYWNGFLNFLGDIMHNSTCPKTKAEKPQIGQILTTAGDLDSVQWCSNNSSSGPQHLHRHPDETRCTVFSAATRKKSLWQVRPGVIAETQHFNWQRGLTAAMCAGMLTSWFSNRDIKFYSRAGALSLPSMFGSLWQQVCFSHGRTVGGAKTKPAGEPKNSRPERMWRRCRDHNKVRWANQKCTSCDFCWPNQVLQLGFHSCVVLHMCTLKCTLWRMKRSKDKVRWCSCMFCHPLKTD